MDFSRKRSHGIILVKITTLDGRPRFNTTDWFEAEDRSPKDCSKLLGIIEAWDSRRELLKIWKPPGEQ